MKQELINLILGDDITFVMIIALYFFVTLGVILREYLRYKKRGKPNIITPEKFSISYWIKDNLFSKLFSFVANGIVVFVTLRFSNEILHVGVSMFLAFTVGLFLDYFISKLENLKPTK